MKTPNRAHVAQMLLLFGLSAAAAFAQSGDISGAFTPAVHFGWIVIAIFSLAGAVAGALVYRAGREQDQSRERSITGAVGFVVSVGGFIFCLVRLFSAN
jgi:hypothetical protein